MKLNYPATQRNKHAILDALRSHLPATGTVLEIASGSGQHAVHFASELPHLTWQPSSLEAEERASIAAYQRDHAVANMRPPVALDVTQDPWPLQTADAVVCINMIHIAPWTASEALFAGAARLLSSGAPLITYGPYRFNGRHVSESNVAFDASLRQRDERWGIRDVDTLEALGRETGFSRETTLALPANNHLLVWRRA